VQQRPQFSCQTEKKNSLKGPLLFQEHPGPWLLGTLHKMFDGETRGVSHCVALPFTLKSILRQKKELWKLKYFTTQKL
jgi:hypothetical protein